MSDLTFPLAFPAITGKEITARFDGGDITSDAGLLLLGKADQKLGLISSVAQAVADPRQQSKVRYEMSLLMRQRIFGIAAGYEDANDHDTLRRDGALKMACGRAPQSGEDLASQPTLSRLENQVSRKDLWRMAVALARIVVTQLPADSQEIILDVDATEDPCHGQQEFEFFNAFYDSHCFLPLLLFVTGSDGQLRLMGSVLRPGKASGTLGLRVMLKWAARLIRERFPKARLTLRADSGFGNAKTLGWCERLGLEYTLGVPKNSRLTTLSTPVQMDACLKYSQWGYLPQRPVCREFGEFEYKARSWSHPERIIVKAEITQGTLNPRFVVTSDRIKDAISVYDFYCARGNAENVIKEFKCDLHADRTSCHRFLANQCRLLWHACAWTLMQALRDAASSTRYANAQMGTLRLRLLKVGARVVESVRRIWLHLSSSYPDQDAWHQISNQLNKKISNQLNKKISNQLNKKISAGLSP